MIRAVVKAAASQLQAREQPSADLSLADCALHESKIYHAGQWHAATIYDRSRLHSGLVVPGASIITEMDSTTLVLPGFQARVDRIGNLLIEPASANTEE
jgi:N-methylhydantoinase A